VAELDDVYLYTVDDLAQVVQTGKAHRQAAVAEAEVIIDQGVKHFGQWQQQRRTVPLIQHIQNQADAWRQTELAKARKQLAKGEPVDAVLEQLARGLSQKMLHGAMAELQSPHAPPHAAALLSRLYLRSGVSSPSAEPLTPPP
jgi:glutamyl-tRNA reductase